MKLAQSAAEAMTLGSTSSKALAWLGAQPDWLNCPAAARNDEYRAKLLAEKDQSFCGFCRPEETIEGVRLDVEERVGIWQNSWPHANARSSQKAAYQLEKPGEHFLLIPQARDGRHPLHFAELELETLSALFSLVANAADRNNSVFFMRFGSEQDSTATYAHLHAQLKVLEDPAQDGMITSCSAGVPFDEDGAITLELNLPSQRRAPCYLMNEWQSGELEHPELVRWAWFEQVYGGCMSFEDLLGGASQGGACFLELFQLLTHTTLNAPLAGCKPPVPGGIVVIKPNTRHGQLEAHCLQFQPGRSYWLTF